MQWQCGPERRRSAKRRVLAYTAERRRRRSSQTPARNADERSEARRRQARRGETRRELECGRRSTAMHGLSRGQQQSTTTPGRISADSPRGGDACRISSEQQAARSGRAELEVITGTGNKEKTTSAHRLNDPKASKREHKNRGPVVCQRRSERSQVTGRTRAQGRRQRHRQVLCVVRFGPPRPACHAVFAPVYLFLNVFSCPSLSPP